MAALNSALLQGYRGKLGNAGTRSKIPDAYLKALSPGLFAQRSANKAAAGRASLFEPTNPLSGSEIDKLSSIIAGLKVDPQVTDLQNQRKSVIANQAALAEKVAGFNKFASDTMETSVANAKSAQEQLSTSLSDSTKRATDFLTTQENKAQDFVGQDAALRGSGLEGGMAARLTADFQMQRDSIVNTQKAREDAGNTVGAGWAGLASMMQGAQAMRAAQDQTDIGTSTASQVTGINQKIGIAEAQRGPEKIDAALKLKNTGFDQAAAAQTLKLKTQAQIDAENKTKVSQDQGQQRIDIDKARLTAQRQHYKAADQLRRDLAQLAHGDRSASLKERIHHDQIIEKQAQDRLDNANKRAGKGKLSPSGVPWLAAAGQATQTSFFHKIRDFAQANKSKGRAAVAQQLLHASEIAANDKKQKGMRAYAGASPAIISAALDDIWDGHLSAETVTKLHQAGIRVGSLPTPHGLSGTVAGALKLPSKLLG